MAASEAATPRSGGWRRPTRMLERSLAEVGHVVQRSLFAEDIARRDGLLQRLDPRMKIVAFLALLLAVSLSRNLWVIVALYGLAVGLAARSAVPLDFFVKRVWLFMPFFTGMIALPALFLTPGPPLATLPGGLVVTRPGLTTALFLLLRVGTSVSLGLLVVLTTAWATLLKALSVLRVPDGFLLILGMTYRYIYLLVDTLDAMLLSRRSRVVGRLDGAGERRLIAASAGVLLGKSLDLSSEVYLAMQSRGYSGHPRTMDNFRLQPRDWGLGGALLAVAAAATWLGR